MEPTPELLAVPPSTDLFSAADPVAAGDTFEAPQAVDVRARTPTARRLVVAGATGLLLAHLFDMPFLPGGGTPAVGTLFVLGLVAIQALRRHSILQRLLGPPVAALFFAFGLPLILAPFAPHVRYVFFLLLIGGATAVYEWALDGL
jgi:hypothetical protein